MVLYIFLLFNNFDSPLHVSDPTLSVHGRSCPTLLKNEKLINHLYVAGADLERNESDGTLMETNIKTLN